MCKIQMLQVRITSLDNCCFAGATTYTCMANKDGGVEADITVSVLENGDGSSVIKPEFEGESM